MKKIKFGSFPLISVPRKDRDCIDKYCIKNYADLITLNSAVKSASELVDKYITPYAIYKYFKNPSLNEALSNNNGKGENLLQEKAESMQRAFKSLRELSIGIQNIPFYADKVAFPIYLEHQSNAKKDYDYDFLLLTNDLVDKQLLDEIHYDDNITMMFLVLKDIMFPHTNLPDLGVDNDADENKVKHIFAQFLEACKKYEKNPIDIYINIIKMVGLTKTNGNTNPGVINSLTKHLHSAMGSKLNILFAKGEVKSPDYLIQAINTNQIREFLDDSAPNNTTTHLKSAHSKQQSVMNQLPSSSQAMAKEQSTTITTQLEREYLLNKSQHYGNILSMISSLLSFNKQSDIIEEVSDGSLKIKVSLDGETNITVNADDMIDKVRTVYFDTFVKDLINLSNVLFTSFEHKARAALPRDIRDFITKNRQNDFNKRQPDVSDQAIVKQAYAMIDVQNNIIKNAQTTGRQDVIDQANITIDNQYALIKQANNMQMLKQISDMKKDTQKTEKYENRKFRFEENIDSIQGSLVNLLNEIEMMIYSEESLKNFILTYQGRSQMGASGKAESSNLIMHKFETTLAIISSEILQSYETSFRNEVLELYSYFNIDPTDLETTVFDKLENNKEISDTLNIRMQTSLNSLFSTMYRDFGTKMSQAKATYASGRAERNPIIKQTINKKNNFKTFIISQKVLIDLYDILTFIDSQKYIAGLLRFPPNRVNGDLAKMRFLITRLGLQSNPVFIINQLDQSVILSSPDILSLTGTPVFSRITRDQMKAICFIDYQKDLWNSDKIMSDYFTKKIDGNIRQDKEKLKALEVEILRLSKEKTPTDQSRKILQDKINTKSKLQNEIFKKEEKINSQRGINLSTSTKAEFKPGYEPPQTEQRPSYQGSQRFDNTQRTEQPRGPEGYTKQFTSNVNNAIADSNQNQPQSQQSQQVQQPQQSGHMYPSYGPRPSQWNNPYTRR